MYLYETHCHCSQCSHCGHSTSQELVLAYHKAGYAGLVLTDHFISGNTAIDRTLPWDVQMKAYYKAYQDACEAAAYLDFDVLFGIEHAYGDGKEVLVYGIDLDFLLANPDLCDITLDEFVDRVHTAGGLVVQAHPYRDRSYVNMNVGPRKDIVDGIEIHNAGNRPGEDGQALALSREKAYILTCGGDVHNIDDPKLGTAGLAFASRIRNNRELIAALRQGADGYVVQGRVVSQVTETDLP